MNGMLPTHIQRNGRILLKLTIAALVIVLSLSGCTADWWLGEGRGDWTLDLYEGYAISKINSYEILLIYKENPDDSGGSIVIPNFFVTAYQLQDHYICLEGISTQKMSASADELNDRVLCYYIVHTTKKEVVGPFENYVDFTEYCYSLKFETSDEWIKTENNSKRGQGDGSVVPSGND